MLIALSIKDGCPDYDLYCTFQYNSKFCWMLIITATIMYWLLLLLLNNWFLRCQQVVYQYYLHWLAVILRLSTRCSSQPCLEITGKESMQSRCSTTDLAFSCELSLVIILGDVYVSNVAFTMARIMPPNLVISRYTPWFLSLRQMKTVSYPRSTSSQIHMCYQHSLFPLNHN